MSFIEDDNRDDDKGKNNECFVKIFLHFVEYKQPIFKNSCFFKKWFYFLCFKI